MNQSLVGLPQCYNFLHRIDQHDLGLLQYSFCQGSRKCRYDEQLGRRGSIISPTLDLAQDMSLFRRSSFQIGFVLVILILDPCLIRARQFEWEDEDTIIVEG
jgi:hypothetical protein